MRHLALPGVLTIACLACPSPAAAATPTALAMTALTAMPQAQPAADPELQTLLDDFGRLYRALNNSRGLRAEDRPALEALRTRVNGFIDRRPDSVAGVAMGLQLSKWLGEEDQVGSYYDQLSALRPGDAEVAISRLKHRETTEDLSEEDLLAAYEQLNRQFPGSPEVVGSLAAQLKKQVRYADAIAALRAAELDPAEDTQAMFDLADCLFAEHQFEEAAEIMAQLAELEVSQFQLRSNIERMKVTTAEYVDFWAKEQEIRSQEQALDDLPRVAINTAKGRIVVELFENEAPNTVANFISLVEKGFYDGTRFHRWLPDFMIQGGDPKSKADADDGPAGNGNPGYLIPDEHGVDEHRMHFSDSLAMANTGAPNSGGCQFYLNHRPTAWLNGKHTVFGRVLEGHDLARSLKQDDEVTSITVLRKRDHPYEPTTLPLPPGG